MTPSVSAPPTTDATGYDATHPARAALEEKYERLPLGWVTPSKTNPRTHFADAYLQELAASIRDKGVIQPIIVRPLARKGAKPGESFEIVAGECRYRASTRAALTHIPALIRDYSDDQVLEIQLIENIHRSDLTPLEQAVGYRKLIDSNPDKHSAATIAQRVGMSEPWVWDRLKLNDLIAEAQAILEQERMTIGHAILIARLKPADQKRAIAFDDASSTPSRGQGLWRADHSLALDDDAGKKKSKYDGLKPCSVRELEHWIRDHVRFDVEHMAKAQPLAFEAVAATVATAAAQPGRGKKVIAITHEYRVADDARDEAERTYGSQSWQRADGREKSKTCEFSVLGLVVAGDGQGDTLQVCVNRDKCRVHFGAVIKNRDKNQKLRASGKGATAATREAKSRAREEEERRKEEAKREAQAARWRAFYPALRKAAKTAVEEAPATLPKAVFKGMLQRLGLPASTTAAQFQKAVLGYVTREIMRDHVWQGDEKKVTAWAELLGVDIKACEPKAKGEKDHAA